MAVQRLYSCNLCRKGEKSDLIGFEWKSGRTRDVIERGATDHVESHICRPCLEDLVRIAKQVNLAV